MKKRSRKLISILLTLSMLAVLLIPMAAPAAASTGYSAYTAPAVDDDVWTELGTVVMETATDAIDDGDAVIFSLPSGFDFAPSTAGVTAVTNGYALTVGGHVYAQITAPVSIGGEVNSIQDTEFSIDWIDDNQIKVLMGTYDPATPGTSEKAFLKLEMSEIYVDEGFSGDISINAEGPSDSGFPEGDVVVGKVSGGAVTMSVVDDETANDDFTVKFRVKEDRAGALDAETDTIKLTLPDGFVWDATIGADLAESTIWGNNNLVLTINDVDKEEIEIGLTTKSTQSTCFEFSLDFIVDDETDAEFGEVKCEVDGEADITPDELVVGTYGDFGGTIKADGDATEIFAGRVDEDVVDIVVEEGMEGSLIDGRTVLLTISDNARWYKMDDKRVGLDINDDGLVTANTMDIAAQLSKSDVVADDASVELEWGGLTGTDNRTIKLTVDGASNDKAELTLEDISVYTMPNTSGDVTVTVSGSAGLEGEIVIAKVVPTVKIEVSEKKQVQIGKSGQLVGDITITEMQAGAFKEGKEVKIDLPEGVSFTATPSVEVTEGDLDIGQVFRVNSAEYTKDNQLAIKIENESDTPSAIKITGVTLSVDRSVPEGNIVFAVVGSAVNETGGADGTIWPNSRVAAVTVGAEVATPAPGQYKANAAFVIGSTTYTIAGVEYTMDVAPYVKDGRTFLPVRYVAQTLGVADANILWDDASQKVTLIKDGTVVQLTIGSNVLLLNGSSITMDVAPELTSDRTMLPIRFIAQAFGATVGWDEATQTVTLN